MKLTAQNLEDLKKIYKATFSIDLGEDEAIEIGIRMVTIVNAILPDNLSKICKK